MRKLLVVCAAWLSLLTTDAKAATEMMTLIDCINGQDTLVFERLKAKTPTRTCVYKDSQQATCMEGVSDRYGSVKYYLDPSLMHGSGVARTYEKPRGTKDWVQVLEVWWSRD